MTQILAYDNCFNYCSVSLKSTNENIIVSDEIKNNSFSELVPCIQKLSNNKIINKTIITIGPGSFTGLRIGIATAFGIKNVHNSQIIGCSTFDAFLNQFFILNPSYKSSDKPFAILLDAKRRGMFYFKKITAKSFFESDDKNDNGKIIKFEEIDNEILDCHLITNLEKIYDSDINCFEKFLILKCNAETLFSIPENRLTNDIKPIYFS